MAPASEQAREARGPSPGVIGRVKFWIEEKELGREFWTFFVATLCYDFGFAMFLFLFNLFLLDIGFNERQLGLVTGAMTIGGAVATIPIGLLAQRFGLRRMLLAGFTLIPLVSAARTLFVGEWIQVGLAFLTGVCLCSWAVCFSPTAAKCTTEKNRTFAFSLLFSVGICLGGLGGLVGGYLPGWLQTFHLSTQAADAKRIVLLLCCVIVAVGAWPVSRMQLHAAGDEHSQTWSFDPFLLRFLPAIALWSLAAGAFVPFATAYLSRYVHMPLSRIGVIVSLSQLAQVAAILMAPTVFRRCGLVAGIAYTQVATAVALASLARVHSLALVAGLYMCFTAFHWMGGPGVYSLLMNRVAEARRSSASAANTLVTSLCQAIASAVSGAAYVDFGYPVVLSAIAGVALLASLLFWVLLRDRRDGAALTAPAEC